MDRRDCRGRVARVLACAGRFVHSACAQTEVCTTDRRNVCSAHTFLVRARVLCVTKLLILRFVASRAEMLPSEAVPASIWSAHVWLLLRRAMLNSGTLNTDATEDHRERQRRSVTRS